MFARLGFTSFRIRQSPSRTRHISPSRIRHIVTVTVTVRLGTNGDLDDSQDGNHDTGLTVAQAKPKLKKPPLYKVIMLNDDYTPMEFVVHVLQLFFGMGHEKATQVMLAVHTSGSAVCGVYTRDVADSKAGQVNNYARKNQHPLLSQVEVDKDD